MGRVWFLPGIGTRRADDAVEIMVNDACGGIGVAELSRVVEPGGGGCRTVGRGPG